MSYTSFRNDQPGDAQPGLLRFQRTNNFGSVAANNLLGEILWEGFDATVPPGQFKSASYIQCKAVGAPAANVPSELQFNTSFGTGTQLAMNIGQYGDVTINTQLGTALNINGVASGIAAQINNVGTSLDFSSTGQRITADMSNATHVNRLSFQSNVVNGATSPFILPNGTSQTASIIASNNSTPTNSAFAQLQVDSTSAKVVSGILGTGTLLPLELRVGNANTAVSISTNRNVTINAPVSGTALTIVAGGETITAGDLTLSNGNVNLSTTSATSGIINVNATRFMHAYGTNNTFLGSSAGNFTLTATQTTALGASAGNNITTGGNSVYIGYQAGNTVSGGNENTVIGSQAFASANASQNVVIGYQAGYASTGFTACTVLGKFALNNTNTGLYNLMLGYGSGTNYNAGESSNICLHSDGVAGESNVCRIGQSTGTGNRQIQNTYIQGYVNLPGQVSFGAFLTAGLANQTGAGGAPDIAFDGLTSNVGNAYNPVNGRVTAPVTGKYLIGASVTVNNISALMTEGVLQFWRYNAAGGAISAYAYNYINPAAIKTPGDICSFQGHIVIPMNATDYVTVKCILLNGAANTAGYTALGARETSIYGQLLS